MAGRDQRLAEIAEWVKETCLLFGAGPEAAYEVAGVFTKGLRREWEKREQTKEETVG